MTTLAKVGIATALGAVVIPSAVLGSLKESAHQYLTRRGYSERSQDKLADFDKNRNISEGGLFGLGCHRVVFGGKNLLRLKDKHESNGGNWSDKEPEKGYFGDEKEPVLGCSTASIMNSPWGKVYDYELALKRGEKGFLERITIWEGNATNKNPKAISQLVFYEKNNDEATNVKEPWNNIYGLQRSMGYEAFEIGNPITRTWTELKDLEKSTEIDKPKYFSVWISDSNGQDLLGGLGVKIKSSQKIFSSIAKAANEEEWRFKFFGHDGEKFVTKIESDADKVKATYTSEIEKEVSTLKGSWKQVEGFCDSQQDRKHTSLPHDDVERLRDYCYTNKTKKVGN